MSFSWALPLILGALITLAYRYYLNYRLHHAKLRPNCLLTRYPLVFLKTRSFSLPLATRDPICRGLAEHGYETLEFKISSRSSSLQSAQLHKLFSRLEIKFGRAHLFFDSALSAQAQELQSSHAHVFASAQELSGNDLAAYLDRAISLAENDIR